MQKKQQEKEAKRILLEQNTICLLEFQANYNKSEYQRIFATGEYKFRAIKLEKELQEKADKLNKGIKVTVSDEGTIQILKKETSLVEGVEMFKNERTIFAKLLNVLPYAYVMGKKVSKKVMEEIFNKYKQYTNLQEEEK